MTLSWSTPRRDGGGSFRGTAIQYPIVPRVTPSGQGVRGTILACSNQAAGESLVKPDLADYTTFAARSGDDPCPSSRASIGATAGRRSWTSPASTPPSTTRPSG